MARTPTPLPVHLVGAAVLCATIAAWTLHLLHRPAMAVAVTPATQGPPEPDLALAARMFGDLGASATAALSVQVGGVLASSRDPVAVLAVDGRPPRAVRLGQEVAPGTVLAQVSPQEVTLDRAGARLRYPVPVLAAPRNGAAPGTAPATGSAAAGPGLGASTGGASAVSPGTPGFGAAAGLPVPGNTGGAGDPAAAFPAPSPGPAPVVRPMPPGSRGAPHGT